MTSQAGTEPRPTSAGFAALALIAVSVLLTMTIGLLGPSAMVPGLPGPAWQPPYSLDVHPAPHLVVALGALAIVVGGLGLFWALGSRAIPSARFTRGLVMAGCVAAAVLAFLPPSGSADHLNYAAYGRMVTLGLDPYAHGAVDLPGDPVAAAVEQPWREEPSVYGPVATAVQALTSWIGGDSVRLTIFVLALVNAAAFIATGLLLDRFTRADPALRWRAALLWTANPLLLYQLVAGLHVDTLAIAFMVAALVLNGTATTGVMLGLGVAVKLNAGLVALGPAWELRRRPKRLALVAGTALAVAGAGYLWAGGHAFDQVSRAGKAISLASFWRLVQGGLQAVVGTGSAYRGEIQVGAFVVMALLAWALFRLWRPPADAVRVAAVLVVAYVFATPYILPWYDGLAFALVAMLAASGVELFLVGHLTMLSLAYLPARVEAQPDDLAWLTTVVRAQVVPWLLLALTAGLGWWAWRAGARARTRPE
ncbi:polyprenol phosphomannose-dependent alpha 1,6 mannosyltransferase MptB [Nonomuraea sp. NPDC059194]|uniref:polyprenol phosphomannose-dependent alpha 1,6 mannosyltransferase MptB n=1 Tax=Nonomuraea sp. NPDC059194 TaxID=3346764 RepID=UPI0036B7AC41